MVVLTYVLIGIASLFFIFIISQQLCDVSPIFDFIGKIAHDVLDWHIPDKNGEFYSSGINFHARCRYCGEDIIQDSQGNWF